MPVIMCDAGTVGIKRQAFPLLFIYEQLDDWMLGLLSLHFDSQPVPTCPKAAYPGPVVCQTLERTVFTIADALARTCDLGAIEHAICRPRPVRLESVDNCQCRGLRLGILMRGWLTAPDG
jgi:hypothetical protein